MKTHKTVLFSLLMVVFTQPILAQQVNPVIVAPVKATTLSGNIQTLGDLQAINNVNLTSQVTDYITGIYFEDGQRVNQGDTLIVMDTADEQALLAEEKARLDEARRQVDRLNPLIEKMAASRSALDTQKSLVAISKARIQGIQAAIDKRTIKAPFDGVIGLRQISIGSLAQPGMQLATLDQDSQMKLDFTVSADQLSQLQPGLSVSATTTAYPDKTFTGTLVSLDSRVNPVTRMIRGRVIIDNQDFLLKTGLLMRVNIAAQAKPAILFPEEALISEGGQHYVFVVEHNDDGTRVRKQAIKIGDRRQGEIAVIDGLSAGQQVVIHGGLRIHDGAPVTITAVKKANERLTDLLQQNRSES